MSATSERVDVVVIGSGRPEPPSPGLWRSAAPRWSASSRATGSARRACPPPGATSRSSLRRGPDTLFPSLRKRPEDYPIATEGGLRPDQVLMYNGVGGTTVHWEGHFPRMHPSDFRVRSLDGVADDWPIRYEELERYYDLNDRHIGVSGLAGDPANPPRAPRPTPPLPLGARGRAVARGFEKLGWHWWPSDNAILSRDYDGRKACDFRGRCNFGCARRARASTDVTYWPKALRARRRARTWARAREITVDARGRARGVLYHDRSGQTHEQAARVVVVCANGVGTPRLLLHSRSRLFPDGLANSSGAGGPELHGRIRAAYVEGVFEARVDGHVGVTSNPLLQPSVLRDRHLAGLRARLLAGRLRPDGAADTGLGRRGAGALGRGASSRDATALGPHHRHRGHGRGPAGGANRVTLDPEAKDSSGIPAPRVRYTFSENSLKMLEHGARAARQVLEAAGAVQVRDTGAPNVFAHLMGTARMGSDPRRSVVDAWNRAHDVPNLFVVDGSSFTTAAAVNPTSTIGALALRAADGIWETRREWE